MKITRKSIKCWGLASFPALQDFSEIKTNFMPKKKKKGDEEGYIERMNDISTYLMPVKWN